MTDPTNKKDQLAPVLKQCRVITRVGPVEFSLGGLGAEESRTEWTGPTQCFLFAIGLGARWAKLRPECGPR